MHTPPQTHIAQNDTARLIPSKYSPDEASVLTRIADDDGHLQTIFALDAAANDRLRAMADQLGGIAAAELVTDAPFASVINAAFDMVGKCDAGNRDRRLVCVVQQHRRQRRHRNLFCTAGL